MNATTCCDHSVRVKRWALAACLAALLSVATPAASMASDEDSTPTHDARLDGYGGKGFVLDAGGTAVTYIVMGLLGALCIGVLFMDGKRTHLD